MLLILDVDGVLTDGKKYYDNTGKGVLKTFCDRDFTAIKQFKAAGWKVVFLSGDENINQAVAKNRSIKFYSSRNTVTGNMIDKAKFVKIFEEEYGITPTDMVYVGDDIFDVSIMKKVGDSFCPKNSPMEVQKQAIILDAKSGEGVIVALWEWYQKHQPYFVRGVTIRKVIQIDRHEKF